MSECASVPLCVMSNSRPLADTQDRVPNVLNPKFFGTDGELGGLFNANHLLSQRFPSVLRPHLEHVPKVITQSLQVEATLMFANMSTVSASKRFRELPIGHGDLQSQWLQVALRTERWREALLWTWVVAKLGGAEGRWEAAAREEVARLLGKRPGTGGSVEVVRGPRKTLEHVETNFAHAGWATPKDTEYLWSSLDGHMPDSKEKTADPVEAAKCTIDLEQCFDTFWTEGEDTTAAHMFKHLAFRRPECGDCLLVALVTASGPLGLKEVFPSPEAAYTIPKTAPAPPYIAPPHLPMTPTWEEADFSLAKSVAKTALPGDTVPLRQWCMHLLSRYLYTYGEWDVMWMGARMEDVPCTPPSPVLPLPASAGMRIPVRRGPENTGLTPGKSNVVFKQLRNPEHTAETFALLDKITRPSVLCLNDDIERNYTEVRELVGDWFEKRWPEKAGWER